MFITTDNGNKFWTFRSLFDAQTGIRYVLLFRHDPKHRDGEDLFLDVDSAHATQGEQGAGFRLDGQEALDFWKRLMPLVGKEPSGLQAKWIHRAGKDAEMALESIVELEAR